MERIEPLKDRWLAAKKHRTTRITLYTKSPDKISDMRPLMKTLNNPQLLSDVDPRTPDCGISFAKVVDFGVKYVYTI